MPTEHGYFAILAGCNAKQCSTPACRTPVRKSLNKTQNASSSSNLAKVRDGCRIDNQHPFGSRAASRQIPARPLALRPGIAAGLPFRGREAAGSLVSFPTAKRREKLAMKRSRKIVSAQARHDCFVCANETYVTFGACQILTFSQTANFFKEMPIPWFEPLARQRDAAIVPVVTVMGAEVSNSTFNVPSSKSF